MIIKENPVKTLGTNGKSIVFLHGFNCQYASYMSLIRKLSEKHTIYFFNLPGHNSSKTTSSPEKALDIVIEKIGSIDDTSLNLVGHSLGGYFAIESAKKLENIERLILLDPLYTNTDVNFIKLSILFIWDHIRAVIYNPSLLSFYLSSRAQTIKVFLSQRTGFFTKTLRLVANTIYRKKSIKPNDIKGINIDVLFGESDLIINRNELPELLQKHLEIVKGSHVWPMIDVEKTAELLNSYLA